MVTPLINGWRFFLLAQQHFFKRKKEKKESADRGYGMRKCKVFDKKILPDLKKVL